jgi:4'-phosphopantetheinyl transferase
LLERDGGGVKNPPDRARSVRTSDGVEVWAADLTRPIAASGILWTFLDAGERARADRFYFAKDREAFVAARGLLRALLGDLLDCDPRDVRFELGQWGKPRLAGSPGFPSLQFNLSHTDGLVLIGTGRREIGVDVERVRELTDMMELADRFFSRTEVEGLRKVPAAERPPAFFRCWTAKEAYIKARGEGLSMPLDRFAVSLAPASGRIALAVTECPEESRRWRLERFEPRPGFVAAVAVEGDGELAGPHWLGEDALLSIEDRWAAGADRAGPVTNR